MLVVAASCRRCGAWGVGCGCFRRSQSQGNLFVRERRDIARFQEAPRATIMLPSRCGVDAALWSADRLCSRAVVRPRAFLFDMVQGATS